MLEIKHDKSINRLVLLTDDPSVHFFLESKQSEYAYCAWKKQYDWVHKIIKVYEPTKHSITGGYRYVLGIGWAGYLLGVFKEYMSKENYDDILYNIVLADSYRTAPFPELRDYQNDDILFLLKYRVGLVTVNTGYGKTQTIATLTNYAYRVLGKKVLIVTPNNKAKDELIKRCKNVFGLEVSDGKNKLPDGELDCLITAGVMNSGRIKDPEENAEFLKMLSGYEWVLADEVEYTINNGGKYIYDHCTGAERFYAFSGTADKTAGEIISFAQGLSEVVLRNKDLIKYFGPSLVYRMPLNISISNIKVKTMSLDDLHLDREKIDDSGNLYSEIMTQIWSNPDVCNTLVRIIRKYPRCFIPINNLVNILYFWIENYFIGRFRTLLVCGEGYIYYDLTGHTTHLTLQEACDKIEAGEVDVIPSTSSGYRALDFPGLENIFLAQGKVAGVTLQTIGRCARGKHMNIISLEPFNTKKKIPVYTNGSKNREEMIKSYYKYCEIEDVIVVEDDL